MVLAGLPVTSLMRFAARRCGECDFKPVILEKLKDSVEGRCLSRSGAAGQYEQPALDSRGNSLALELSVFYAALFLYSASLAFNFSHSSTVLNFST